MVDISTLAQPLIEGLLFGAVLALAALGVSLIFSIMGVLNLAHGNFIMSAAILTYYLFWVVTRGNPAPIALFGILIVVLVFFGILGMGFEIGLVRPVLKRSYNEILISSILITIGIAFIMQDLGFYILAHPLGSFTFGEAEFAISSVKYFGSYQLGFYYLSSGKIVSLIAIGIASVALLFFFKGTYLGKAMRSITQDKEAAEMLGVNIRTVSLITFALGSSFAGFAGFILVIDQSANPFRGIGLTITLLTVMVLGGVRSPLGPIIGGLLLGATQYLVAAYVSSYWSQAISLVVLIAILLIRPTGLTGGRIA
jgi:branched-chain amino acid transport system permease protein